MRERSEGLSLVVLVRRVRDLRPYFLCVPCAMCPRPWQPTGVCGAKTRQYKHFPPAGHPFLIGSHRDTAEGEALTHNDVGRRTD